MDVNVSERRTLYWKLAAFFFFFQMTWSAGYSLFALWLGQTIKLDGTTIGIVFSTNAFVAMVTKPVYGFILDRIGTRKDLLWLITGLTLLIGPFFIYVYHPLLLSNFWAGTIVGSLYLGAAYLAGIAAIESYVEKCGRRYNLEYGRIRMWGSLGWAVSTFYAGRIFNVDPDINFWIASGTALIVLLVLLSIKVKPAAEIAATTQKIQMADVRHLFALKSFWCFALFVAGVAWMYFVVEQQFPRYFVTFFATKQEGTAMYGYLNSFQIFLEAGMMFSAPYIVNKLGPKNGLLLAGLVCAVRLIGSGFAWDAYSISAFKLLHAVELPILLVSIFKYIAEHFEQKIGSTMYLLGYQCFLYVGVVAIGPMAGKMYDQFGFSKTYIVMGSIAFVFTLISSITLSASKKEAPGITQAAQAQ